MMTIPNTVSEFSKYAAQEFLQTAVFIDDRIYERKDGSISESKPPSAPRSRPKALKSANKKVSSNVSDKIEESDQKEYSPRKIVTSFAKKQIICSLYQPEREAKFSERSDVFSLCVAADIVIVDWDLHGDAGTKALELVGELIQRAVTDVPEQLRLILVYTDQVDLEGIGGRLYEKICISIGEKNLSVEDDGLAFHTLNSRVSILGKENGKRPNQYKNHEVIEKELADKAIEEFTKLASGLLYGTALKGLAEIRKNSRKILSKFNSSLDPAFLTHRAMLLGSDEDASNHIIPLLVSEIESVLEDVLPLPLITEQLITDWCMNVWEPGSPANDLLPGKSEEEIRGIATDFCLEGEKAKEKNNQILKLNSNQNVRKFSKLLLASENAFSNYEFSHLMASRTFYGKALKTLRLGSVIHDLESDQYLLCIQPVCDSVRLGEKRKFLFVELTRTDSGNGYASHVIIRDNGEAMGLYYQPKSFKCYMAEFSPDSRSKQVQVPKPDNNFVDTAGKKYVWIDQLKTSHAQRAVERYARELSRVGLTESEWLRRLDKK